MEVDEFSRRFTAAIGSFPDEMKARLLGILDLPNKARAAAIGELYGSDRLLGIAELLIDLEEAPAIRQLVAAEIRNQVRPGEV